MKEIDKKIVEIVSEYTGIQEEKIHPNMHIYTDLMLDSLGIQDLLLILEDEFQIKITDQKFTTLRDVINYIEEAKYGNTS